MLTACQSCNPTIVPVKTGYGIPTFKFETDTIGTSVSMEDEVFVDVDLNTLIDSLRIYKGYTFQTGGLTIWIGKGQDSTGHVGVRGKGKMKLYIK